MSSTSLKNLLIPGIVVLLIIGILLTYVTTNNAEPEAMIAAETATETMANEQTSLSAMENETISDNDSAQPETQLTIVEVDATSVTEANVSAEAVVTEPMQNAEAVTTEPVIEQEKPAAPVVTLVEGSDYITKFPNELSKSPVLVEFFSYMCPACYNFEATVVRWEKQKPDSVELLKIPVSFGRGGWRLAAKSYYIAEELNVVTQFNRAMFRKIHIEKKPPTKESHLGKIFESLGITTAAFNNAANSFNVDSKLRKADFLAKKYKVSGVPYFLINFKYEIGKASYESEQSLFKLWNNLPGKDF